MERIISDSPLNHLTYEEVERFYRTIDLDTEEKRRRLLELSHLAKNPKDDDGRLHLTTKVVDR